MNRTQNFRSIPSTRKRNGFGCDGVDGAFDDSEIVVSEQVIVASSLAIV